MAGVTGDYAARCKSFYTKGLIAYDPQGQAYEKTLSTLGADAVLLPKVNMLKSALTMAVN